VEVLEKSKESSVHWQKIWENITGYKIQASQTQIQETFYSDSLLVNDKIAIMRIKSFFYDNLANDSVQIISFLKRIQDYDYLIIDIQDNGGGSSNYWKNYIVGKTSDTPVIFPRNQIAKIGSHNRHFFPEIEQWDIATKQNAFFPNMPNEILDGTYYLHSFTDTIQPNNPIPFKGKIFVLVNNMVVSASEDFAYFCKISKWATVAGIQTMGDGNCSEPTIFMLPNSGITFRHPSVVGLNEDGSFNFETRTIPNIEIKAKNSDERLERLINHIKSDGK
jgi:C-terminal processing protease CtpA/Prc